MSAYTVVIPAFNAEATLGDAIGSVLAQSVPPAAMVVVDDGSTDGTAAVAESFGGAVHLITQANAGPGAATTRGLREVSTPFVATLDADDLWLPEKAERQLAILRSKDGVSGLCAHVRLFAASPDDPRQGRVLPGWSRTTIMMRAALFADVGAMIDPPGRRGEFIDWLARARESGATIPMMDDVLALRRIRPGSLSSGRDPKRDRGYLHVVRQAMRRRRAAEGGSSAG